MTKVNLGFDTKEFNKDLKQIGQTVTSLIQLDIVQREDINMIQERIWETIPKYVVTSVC